MLCKNGKLENGQDVLKYLKEKLASNPNLGIDVTVFRGEYFGVISHRHWKLTQEKLNNPDYVAKLKLDCRYVKVNVE